MQEQVQKMQEEAENETAEASVGGWHGEGDRERRRPGARDRDLARTRSTRDDPEGRSARPRARGGVNEAAFARRRRESRRRRSRCSRRCLGGLGLAGLGMPELAAPKSKAQPHTTTPVSASTMNARTQFDAGAGDARTRLRYPGRRGMSAADGYAPQMLSPAVENLVAQLTRLPGIGSGRRSGSRSTSSSVSTEEALMRSRERDRGREGARPLLQRVRQPHRGGDVRDLPRRAARPRAHLRRRAAGRPRLARARPREYRGLYHVARRRAVAARRRRAVAPAHRRAAAPRRAERRAGGRARDEPEHDRRGDRRVPRRPAARPRARDAASRAACPSAATSSTRTR